MNTERMFLKNTQWIRRKQCLSNCLGGVGLILLLLLSACMNTPDVISEPNGIDETLSPEEIDSGIILGAQEGGDSSGQSSSLNKETKEQCLALADAFNQKMTDAAGWVHGVKDRAYFNTNAGEYDPIVVEEFWYRFDSEGIILEGYEWNGTSAGEIQQEGVWLNGWYDGDYVNGTYNLDVDFGPDGEIQGPHTVVEEPLDFSAGFCANLGAEKAAKMTEVDFHGQAAWKFTYDSISPRGTMTRGIYFSREDGSLLGFDSNLVQSDGTEKLISEVAYRVFELNANPPQERFAEIWARVPHGEDFVPVDKGTH